MSRVIELTEGAWDDQVLASAAPVLVDVWAPWCVPCRRVRPLVEELAEVLGDRLVVGALNGDDAPRIMGRYQVLSLPTLLLFAAGEPVMRVQGVPRPGRLRAMIEPHLAAA